jgi:hypothetical protein
MDTEAYRDGSGDGPRDAFTDGPWLTVAEAARRLRVSPRAVRGRIRRGTLRWKAAGNAGKLVLLPPPDGSGDGSRDASPDGPEDAAEAWFELEMLREELEEARVARARAEERAAAKEELIAELKAMLAEARRPWWRRWVG